MNKSLNALLIITLLVVSVLSLVTIGVHAQDESAILELTVRQVVVVDGIATVTGLASGSTVELYDNLGISLLDSGLPASDGNITFSLDQRYPLSGKGLYHTRVKVDGVDNGVMTCRQGTSCQAAAFSITGLDPNLEDGILVVRVIRSDDLLTPVEGVRTNVWPVDMNGTPLIASQPPEETGKWGNSESSVDEYNGLLCLTNSEGYCAVYLDQTFHWGANEDGLIVTNLLVKLGSIISYDGSYYHVPEGGFLSSTIAVDQKGKLDDCVIKGVPLMGLLK